MAANTHGVTANFCLVIADSIRNPVLARHWIPDQVRNDKLGVRDDKLGGRDDSCRVRKDRLRN